MHDQRCLTAKCQTLKCRPAIWLIAFFVLMGPLGSVKVAKGDLLNIGNNSFEDTTGNTVYNEFTFGTPPLWQRHDPNDITQSAGVYYGTLQPSGVDNFDTTAPDGDLVAILFNSQQKGAGEYGLEQTLAATLQANTSYSLTVQVGNIASGTAADGTFFNLDEFPGYRVDLMAGETVLAQDLNSLSIPEAQFGLSTVQFTTGDSHAQLGQNIRIRLVNLNQISDGYTAATSPDLEVDFDSVQLDAVAVPEANSCLFFVLASFVTFPFRRFRSARSNV